MVMPDFANPIITSSTSLIISGSRADVGSSNSMIFGWPAHGSGPGAEFVKRTVQALTGREEP
jgi:hypothetical protein